MLYSPTINRTYLPSATKLRRLYFHRRLSVHKGLPGPGGCLVGGCLVRGGGAWSQGGGCLVPGVPGPGGAWSGGVGIPACTEADQPPGETATAADGTHPTGMHSCTQIISSLYR